MTYRLHQLVGEKGRRVAESLLPGPNADTSVIWPAPVSIAFVRNQHNLHPTDVLARPPLVLP